MLFRPMLGSAMSGKLGGNVWSHNSGGTYARVRNAVTNPNSGRQNVSRNALGLASQIWSLTLSQAERDSWAAYAAQVGMRNRIGDAIFLAGNTQFNRTNSIRILAGLSVVYTASADFNLGTLTLPVLSNRVDGSSPSIDLDFNVLDTWHDGTTSGALLVFASPSKSATINFYRGPYQLVATIPGDAVGTQTIPLRGVLASGQKVFFRYIATTSDGRTSMELFDSNPGSVAPTPSNTVQMISAASDGGGASQVTISFATSSIDAAGTFDPTAFTTDFGATGTAASGATADSVVITFDDFVANGDVVTMATGAVPPLAGFTVITPQSVIAAAAPIPLTIASAVTDGLLNSHVTLTFNEPGLQIVATDASTWTTDTPATATAATNSSTTVAEADFALSTVASGDTLTIASALGLTLRSGFALTFPFVQVLA